MSGGSPSPILSPLAISEDLLPVPPPRLAGDVRQSFSGVLDPPLVLHEDLKDGCGGQTWPAGMLLACFLLRRKEAIIGKTMLVSLKMVDSRSRADRRSRLELGAGSGLVGIALALGLLQDKKVIKPFKNPILTTDLPILLPLQRQNVALNGLSGDFIQAEALPWGEPLPLALPAQYRRPDVILAADCVYFEPAFPLLLKTLEELMGASDDGHEGRNPVCWFSMKKRRKADMRFVRTLRKAFVVREVDLADEPDREGVLLLVRTCTTIFISDAR